MSYIATEARLHAYKQGLRLICYSSSVLYGNRPSWFVFLCLLWQLCPCKVNLKHQSLEDIKNDNYRGSHFHYAAYIRKWSIRIHLLSVKCMESSFTYMWAESCLSYDAECSANITSVMTVGYSSNETSKKSQTSPIFWLQIKRKYKYLTTISVCHQQ